MPATAAERAGPIAQGVEAAEAAPAAAAAGMLAGRLDTAAALGIAAHRVAGIGSRADTRLIHHTANQLQGPLSRVARSKTYRCRNWAPLSQCRARSRLEARRCIAAAGYTCSVLAAAAVESGRSGRARSTVVEPCRCSSTWLGRGKGVGVVEKSRCSAAVLGGGGVALCDRLDGIEEMNPRKGASSGFWCIIEKGRFSMRCLFWFGLFCFVFVFSSPVSPTELT